MTGAVVGSRLKEALNNSKKGFEKAPKQCVWCFYVSNGSEKSLRKILFKEKSHFIKKISRFYQNISKNLNFHSSSGQKTYNFDKNMTFSKTT